MKYRGICMILILMAAMVVLAVSGCGNSPSKTLCDRAMSEAKTAGAGAGSSVTEENAGKRKDECLQKYDALNKQEKELADKAAQKLLDKCGQKKSGDFIKCFDEVK